ncbi:thiamine phosphate synthase [Microvirga tunisiensis]|uniref:Thiamine-phosphate synthase n=2 Tax=Pannonibacter tanglangensis TaxID=2750084 RepID=A0A7X5F373_9HYPH|nr:thiamine phosphate synthase [Pannonibacter sp. XCT-53]
MPMRRFDLSLYLVTDEIRRPGLEDDVIAAVRGGVTLVQLRDKSAPHAVVAEFARRLKARLDEHRVPLILNDRVEVARMIGAAGVHIGTRDMTPAEARQMLGPNAIIGVSVSEAAHLDRFDPADVDYVGIGPVHPTLTKPDHATPIGAEGLARLCAAARLPAVAIGGLTAQDAPAVRAAGAQGLAVVSAILSDGDAEQAARRLRRAWEEAASGDVARPAAE